MYSLKCFAAYNGIIAPKAKANCGRARHLTSAQTVTAGTLAFACSASSRGRMQPGSGFPKDLKLWWKERSDRRLTDVLIAVNVGVFCFDMLSGRALSMWGAKVNSLIANGQVWRLLSSNYLHAGLLHLTMNMSSLNGMGWLESEMILGRTQTLVIYTLSGILGSFASYRLSANPSLGASGAICGLLAAAWMFCQDNSQIFGRRATLIQERIQQSALMTLLVGLMIPQIDNWGHVGGFFSGLLVTYLIGPRHNMRSKGNTGTSRLALLTSSYNNGSHGRRR